MVLWRPGGRPHQLIEWAVWEARPQWGGAQVTVSWEEDAAPVAPAELAAAGGRVLAYLKREETARRELATALFDLAEDWWAAREDGASEPPLTLENFMGLMWLDTVVIEKDGGLTVYDDDREQVFAGHAIQASFGADGPPTVTDIPG